MDGSPKIASNIQSWRKINQSISFAEKNHIAVLTHQEILVALNLIITLYLRISYIFFKEAQQ